MIFVGDLLGLEYQWGAHPSQGNGFTDCFALSMEIRRRAGLHDFYPDFQWVYDEYETEGVGGKQILRWIWEKGKKIKEPRLGAVFRGPSYGQAIALAAVVSSQEAIMIGPSKRVIMAPLAKVTKGHFYWAD